MDFLLPHLNTAIAGIFAALFVLFFLLWRSKTVKTTVSKRLAPEAGGAWPIVGHLHLFGGYQVPHITLGAMPDQYGPVFTIQLGVHRALVVSSWEMAEELFTTHDLAISSRPNFVVSKHLGYNSAMFGFSPYGEYWRQLSKITSLELLSNRRLELLKHIRISETETSMKELYKLWAEKKDRRQGCNAVQKVMRDFFNYIGLFAVADNLPFLGWLDLGGYEKAMKETGKEMDHIFEEWLQEHRRKRDVGNASSEQDFIDVMLSITEEAELAGFDADTITKATCMVSIRLEKRKPH
ncbi:unnamed protein product [Ilex paraguariensis]|uniref:Cytochrome P450 n=1 Tax=Ilex paraguariensis TaxID=185542 RepID=A0ABC8R6N5_9AQUA